MQARMCEKLRRRSCFTWECAFQRSANHESRPRTRSSLLLLFSRSYLFAIMADNNGKRKLKAWVYSKEAKVPRTTAWRSKKGTSSSASVSKITTSHVEEVLQSSILKAVMSRLNLLALLRTVTTSLNRVMIRV